MRFPVRGLLRSGALPGAERVRFSWRGGGPAQYIEGRRAATVRCPMSLEDILDSFAVLDEWEDRYRYLIELGRTLEPLEESAHIDANKVRGCASQVWLVTEVTRAASGEPILTFRGDSDAHIVRGLIALILAIYSGKTASEILATDAHDLFRDLGLSAHLTAQRSNGVRAMVERIKSDARRATEAATV